MADTTEARWFKIVTFILSGFFAGLFIANTVYFNRLRLNNGGGGISRGEATAMVWLNGIWAFLSIVLFVWALIRLFVGSETKKKVVTYLTTETDGLKPIYSQPVYQPSQPVYQQSQPVYQPVYQPSQPVYQQTSLARTNVVPTGTPTSVTTTTIPATLVQQTRSTYPDPNMHQAVYSAIPGNTTRARSFSDIAEV